MPIVAYDIKVPSRPRQVDPHVGIQADCTGTSSFSVVGRMQYCGSKALYQEGLGTRKVKMDL